MPSKSDPAGIRAYQVPQSIRFLRSLGVPATRLAGIFGETADNIRHIDIRSYKETPTTPPTAAFEKDDFALIHLTPDEQAAQVKRNLQGIRLRSKQDLDYAEETVWLIYRSRQSIPFEEGYEALLAMRPSVANARHGQALRVLLLIEEKLAWFALQLGRIEEALGHAQAAMARSIDAFKESAGTKDYLLRYGECALVASICLQKLDQAQYSLQLIQAANEANIAFGTLPGSEHLRQFGTSLVQLGRTYDDIAEKHFRKAKQRMQQKGEATNEVDIGMSSLRQRAFLDPARGWDKVLELAEDVKTVYGQGSLQYAVAAKSAAVTGLKYATPSSIADALKLPQSLATMPVPELSQGIPHILSITPDLKLSPDDLDLWLRFAANKVPLPARK